MADMFTHNYTKEVEQTWGVRWECIHVLIHEHILAKIWDQKRGDWNTPGPHQGAEFN